MSKAKAGDDHILDRCLGPAGARGEYPDLHDHVRALSEQGLLLIVDEPINKDTEMHPLVRWQYRGGIPESDRKAYLAAYSRPGRMHAAWDYFVSFQQAAKDFAELSKTRLTMPVLTIGGDKSLGEALGQQARLVASNVTVVVIKDAGHWTIEERPTETTEALQKFL